MVKIYGPMMSLDASGTIAKAVTFSKWKGRNYARQRVIPANPKSGDQIGRRAMFSFLTQEWASFTSGAKATWKDLAEQAVVTNFNAFLSLNMAGWHNFLAPGKSPTLGRAADPSNNQFFSVAWEQNRIKMVIDGLDLNNAWGLIIFASTTEVFTTAVGNAILVKPDLTIASVNQFWTPPKVTTYYLNIRTFSTDGKLSAENVEMTAAPP